MLVFGGWWLDVGVWVFLDVIETWTWKTRLIARHLDLFQALKWIRLRWHYLLLDLEILGL